MKFNNFVFMTWNGNQRVNTANFDYYRATSNDLVPAIAPTNASYHHIVGLRENYGSADNAGGFLLKMDAFLRIYAQGAVDGVYDGGFAIATQMGPYRSTITYSL
jgi:hypothetical protein